LIAQTTNGINAASHKTRITPLGQLEPNLLTVVFTAMFSIAQPKEYHSNCGGFLFGGCCGVFSVFAIFNPRGREISRL
jgi:hypothetical protein